MAKRDDFSTPNKYVAEVIWLPSYAAIVYFILGYIKNSAIQTLTMIIGLLVSRMLLEMIYRIVFGDVRLTLRIGIYAVVGQLVAWGGLLAWWLKGY